jgi:hypothetical protein
MKQFQNSYAGHGIRHTGDINLAAALMACGIPLLAENPVRVIVSNFGQYGSWNIAEASEDGRNITETLMQHWSNRNALPEGHPFELICQFTAARPEGKMKSGDWFDYAIQFIEQMGYDLPGLRGYHDIPYFVEKLPDQPQSYILAFVENRRVCLDVYHSARRATYHRTSDGDDARHAIIDAALPKWQKNELLSRLQG